MKSSLIAMAALAAAANYHSEYAQPTSFGHGIKTNRRGYRKTGQFGVERRKAWLVKKNLEKKNPKSL